MPRRQRRRTGAVLLATAALSACLGAVPAQATPNGLYDCQSVAYLDILRTKPVTGFTCVGPVGPAPAGSVYDLSTGVRYGCEQLSGTVMPNGSLWAHGNFCAPF